MVSVCEGRATREGAEGVVRSTGSGIERELGAAPPEREAELARRDLSLSAGVSGGGMGFDVKEEATGALKDTFLGGMATQ